MMPQYTRQQHAEHTDLLRFNKHTQTQKLTTEIVTRADV